MSAPGGDGSEAVAPENGSNVTSGAPGEGGRGGDSSRLPVSLPPKLLLFFIVIVIEDIIAYKI